MNEELKDVMLALFVFAVVNGDKAAAERIYAEQADALPHADKQHLKDILQGMQAMDALIDQLQVVADAMKDEQGIAHTSIDAQAKQATDKLLASLRLH